MLDDLLEDPQAPARVAAMSTVALHRVINAVGRSDAVDLIAMATPEQVREILDLEVWHGDRVDLEEALDWLHLLATQLPLDVAGRDVRRIDVELIAYVLRRSTRVHLAEEVADDLDGALLPTPDGWFVLELLAEDDTTLQQVTDVVDRLYRIDHEDARRLLQSLMWELPTELEELAYRWRKGRLQDLGFADPEEALLVYAYLDPASVQRDEQSADRALASDPEPVGTSGTMVLAAPVTESFWAQGLDRVTDDAERQRLAHALMALGNRTLSADRIAATDADGARIALEQLQWRLSLGLEHLCSGDPGLAPEALANVALLRIARVGHSLTLDRRRRLGRLTRTGRIGRAPGRLDLVDRPLRQRLVPLLARRPALYDDATGEPRPFRDLGDLERADAWIREAEQLAELTGQIALPSPLPADVTFGDLFRTALVNQLLGRDAARPLGHGDLRSFLERHVSGHGLRPEILEAAMRAVPDTAAHRQLARQWTAELEEAVGRIEAATLDLRFVDGLWLERE